MFKKYLRPIPAGLLLTICLSGAEAYASSFGITYAVDTRACVSSTLCDKKQTSGTNVPNPVTFNLTSSQSSTANGGENAFAQSFGTVKYGQIKGYVHGDSSATSLGEADGITDYSAYWNDVATVTSATLPYGTAVTLALTLSLDATLAGSGTGGSMSLSGLVDINVPNASIFVNTTSPGTFKYSKSSVFTTFVGAQLSLEGGVLMDAVTQSLNCGGCSPSYTVDASHTANFYLDPVTSGVSYTTASGNTYFTPSSVPEPGSMWLLGTGLASIASCLRRRRFLKQSGRRRTHMKTPIRFALSFSTKAITLVIALCMLGLTAIAQQLKITTFDVPGADTNPGDYNGTFVGGINNKGAVTGAYIDTNNVYHGFVRNSDGTFLSFDAPGADTTPNDFNGTNPNAINDLGEITGNYWDINGIPHGFLRKADGSFATFDVPGAIDAVPIALNWEGGVVGYYEDQNNVFHAFMRNPDGSFATWIGPGACQTSPSTGCWGSAATNINGLGVIVGSYADSSSNFIQHTYIRNAQGAFTTFEVPGAGKGLGQGTGCPGCSLGFNQFGVVAGTYEDANSVEHGFVRSSNGNFTTFDAPGAGTGKYQGTGCRYDCPTSINDFGAITGTYLDASNEYHGYLRTSAGNVLAVDPSGSVFTLSSGINDYGVVTGYYQDANNVYHGFLAVPSPWWP